MWKECPLVFESDLLWINILRIQFGAKQTNSTVYDFTWEVERISDADFSANIRNLLFRLGNIIIIWCLLSSEMALVMSIINLLWLYIMFIWKFNLIVSVKQIGNYFNNQFWCICLSFLCLPFTLIINSFLFSKNLTEIKTRNHSI